MLLKHYKQLDAGGADIVPAMSFPTGLVALGGPNAATHVARKFSTTIQMAMSLKKLFKPLSKTLKRVFKMKKSRRTRRRTQKARKY
jgi:glycerol-3-phosphate dehydrogenase